MLRFSLYFKYLLLFWMASIASQSFGKTEILRKIVAFYDDKDIKVLSDSPTHRFAEMPLNHLGLEVIHWPASKPLPKPDFMKNVIGILTWFQSPVAVPKPDEFCLWLTAQMSQGKKLIMLDNPGVFHGPTQALLSKPCHAMLNRLGLRYEKGYYSNPFLLEITQKDPLMMDFERDLTLADPIEYVEFKPVDDSISTHFSLSVKSEPDTSESTLVMTAPNGGFAFTHTTLYYSEAVNTPVWYINPFRFFKHALSLNDGPIPDTSMINGRRIGYMHIDGDGLFNPTPTEAFSGTAILNEVLKKYSNLPFTISFITAYFRLKKYNNKDTDQLYRDLLVQENAEIASHTFAHPLNWNPQSTTVDPDSTEIESSPAYDTSYLDPNDPYQLAIPVEGYTYSHDRETIGSVNDLRELLKRLNINKPVSLLLWSGNCDPTEEALKAAYSHNLLNMNGGDTLSDQKYPGISHVAPLSLLKGQHRQIYSSNANEMLYLDRGFESYFGGFKRVVETYKNTASPRLLKPVNIYFHYYIASQHAGMKALEKAIQYALNHNLFYLFASEYAQLVEDYFSTRMFRLDKHTYFIENKGHLKTIRFDKTPMYVDLKHSQGVIGFKHHQGNLYVFLDESTNHVIKLSDKSPDSPYIYEASFEVSEFRASSSQITFKKRGWHDSECILKGLPADTVFTVSSPYTQKTIRSNEEGHLHIAFKKSEKMQKPTPVLIKALSK